MQSETSLYRRMADDKQNSTIRIVAVLGMSPYSGTGSMLADIEPWHVSFS